MLASRPRTVAGGPVLSKFTNLAQTFSYAIDMGAAEMFPGGGQRQHFAHIFQIVDDAMQMEVNKTLYPFYTPEIMPRVHGRWKGAWEDQGPGY